MLLILNSIARVELYRFLKYRERLWQVFTSQTFFWIQRKCIQVAANKMQKSNICWGHLDQPQIRVGWYKNVKFNCFFLNFTPVWTLNFYRQIAIKCVFSSYFHLRNCNWIMMRCICYFLRHCRHFKPTFSALVATCLFFHQRVPLHVFMQTVIQSFISIRFKSYQSWKTT